MKALNQLRDEELVVRTKQLLYEERQKTLEVIEHLQEIYDRRLHLKHGYQSLHEFLVHEMKYSDGAAHRRISAMRLVKDVPEAKESIASGNLSLTTASQVQSFFLAEQKTNKKTYSQEQKLSLLTKLNGASRQQCEQELKALSPSYQPKTKETVIPEDQELTALLEEYRRLAMLSDGSLQNIIKNALQMAISHLKAKQAAQKKSVKGADEAIQEKLTNLASLEKRASRYIPQKLRGAIWHRDEGRCRYIHHSTKRRCEATHHLEIDHAKPFALDGQTTLENLRLLCRAHNQMFAINAYGKEVLKRTQG